ncbi:P1 family peptidase [Paucibacter sp. PLA-PC-4]|uniref:P1 family peptidase n=1 Tax=Paucibacter sp. PLA-PC-4 TaxID=2993655 RepID=UPI002248EA9F|nr:P1 family peptidase [Paucibacter sp. PLA-PC-4]MCX2863230.1 P1 family peptidase [Paucibacter sp. PLA-PC-4]
MTDASSICDVPGLTVGHHTDSRRPTGCTVVLCPQGATAGVDVRGAAPGTRETDLLAPDNTVNQVHGLLLTGGSAFGLDAAGGVMRWLAERGHGFAVGPARVPIVPAAVLFDLWLGDPAVTPDAASGYAACEAASREAPTEGSVGAGTGATLGKLRGITHAMKGGVGTASVTVGGVTVGALVVVNAIGDIIDPASGQLIAGARGDDGRPLGMLQAMLRGELPAVTLSGTATTLGIVATDASLDKADAKKLAQMAHDGLARTINPVHTVSDGDVIFSLATGTNRERGDLRLLGPLAAEVIARAVLRAVRAATGLPGLPASTELAG